MKYNRKLNFFAILIVMAIILSFAHNYNSYVKSAYAETSDNIRDIIKCYNEEIIAKLLEEDSSENWSQTAQEYQELAIEIENSGNVVLVENKGENFKKPAVKVRTPFIFQEQVFIIESSMFVFKDYSEGICGELADFILIEFFLGMAFLSVFVFAIYIFMLKNYKILDETIEEYEKTGKLRKTALKGYAGHIYNRFKSMIENLERQRKNQQNMIASISHDIKTPLTSVMGYAERLSKDNLSDERRRRYLEIIYGKSVELRELVNEFDEYISFNLAQEKEKDVIDTDYLAQKLFEDFSDDLELSGIDFNVNNLAGNVEICVNQKKLKRVFSNIFSNCEKHFEKELKKINVDIFCDKEKLYINISDNGKGVKKEDLEIIFEPLYTSDEGRKVSGLGLAICREIINSHAGSIYAKESELGGLAVCIELERYDKTKSL